ncbi:hypothetical protein BASA81_008902 [Batrachochytrium salamandrivorans]|nr:hypothetical protein BASA81_008902 [Batrachochytrium salamandrivorans]
MSALNESRAEVEAAILAIHTLDIVGMAYSGLLLVLIPWGMFEQRKDMDFVNNPTARGCLWLFVVSALLMSFFAVEFTTYSFDFSDPAMYDTCQHRAKYIPTCWIICKQFVYLFLFERAVVVHKSVELSKVFLWFRDFVGLLIVFGVGIIFYWGSITLFEGLIYLPEGVCVMSTTATYFIIMFVSCDLVLSAALLFLFIFPLVKHLQGFKRTGMEDQFEDKLHMIMRKNIVLSALVTGSAFVSLVVMLVLVVEAEKNPGTNQHLIIYAMFAPTLDTVICLTLLLQISDMWKPRIFKCKQDANLSATMSDQERNRIHDEEGAMIAQLRVMPE